MRRTACGSGPPPLLAASARTQLRCDATPPARPFHLLLLPRSRSSASRWFSPTTSPSWCPRATWCAARTTASRLLARSQGLPWRAAGAAADWGCRHQAAARAARPGPALGLCPHQGPRPLHAAPSPTHTHTHTHTHTCTHSAQDLEAKESDLWGSRGVTLAGLNMLYMALMNFRGTLVGGSARGGGGSA